MRRLATLLAVVFAFSILAKAKKFPFIAAPNVPGARGQVEFNTDNSGNNHVKLKVEHLASPQNLTPAKNSYVIWFEEPNGYPTIEGVLKVDKNEKAEFETTIPWKKFAVFITAEDEASPKAPAGPELLRATIQ